MSNTVMMISASTPVPMYIAPFFPVTPFRISTVPAPEAFAYSGSRGTCR